MFEQLLELLLKKGTQITIRQYSKLYKHEEVYQKYNGKIHYQITLWKPGTTEIEIGIGYSLNEALNNCLSEE